MKHDWDGPRHTYSPTADPAQSQRSAARHLLETFFNNSMESALAAMPGATDRQLPAEGSQLIEQARRRKSGGGGGGGTRQ